MQRRPQARAPFTEFMTSHRSSSGTRNSTYKRMHLSTVRGVRGYPTPTQQNFSWLQDVNAGYWAAGGLNMNAHLHKDKDHLKKYVLGLFTLLSINFMLTRGESAWSNDKRFGPSITSRFSHLARSSVFPVKVSECCHSTRLRIEVRVAVQWHELDTSKTPCLASCLVIYRLNAPRWIQEQSWRP